MTKELDIFETVAKRLGKGYPEFDADQVRAADGTWSAGGGGGGSAASSEKPSGGGSKLRTAATIAGLAAAGATLGVPGLRSAPGLRHLRNKLLGFRTGRARRALENIPASATRVAGARSVGSRHVRAQAEAIRNLVRQQGLNLSPAARARRRLNNLFNSGGGITPAAVPIRPRP